MKRDDHPHEGPKDFTEKEAWSRFERAVDGAAKHGPARKAPSLTVKRQRSGANKRRTGI
jgi:hypothetical protein